jgi:hypothetical protein
MARYLVERSFADGLDIPISADGTAVWVAVVEGNAAEAIRRAAERNQLPIHAITRVTVLDPYFYK